MKTTLEIIQEQIELLDNLIKKTQKERENTYWQLRELEEDLADKHPEAYEHAHLR